MFFGTSQNLTLKAFYLYNLNSLPFSVHTLKIEYNVSLFVVPTLLKELLNVVYQTGLSHTHTHKLVTELRRVNVDIQVPQLHAYLPSWSICSPHVADGQQSQEKCEFGAATVKLVQPSVYRVGPLLIN